MATTNNEVLGYRICSTCGDRGSVHKAKGRRNQLYQRNCRCGCAQANGPEVQSALWYETEWLPGLKPADPPGNLLTPQAYRLAISSEAQRLQERLGKPGQDSGQNSGQTGSQTKENQGLQPDDDSGQNSGQQTDFDPTVDPKVNQEADRENPVKRPIGLWWLVAAMGIVTAVVAR